MLCYERQDSFLCFVSLEEGWCLSWNFTSESALLTKFCGWRLCIRCLLNEVMARSFEMFLLFFFWRVCSKEPFFAPGSLRASSPSDLGCQGSPFYLCDKTSVVLFFCEVVVWERLGHWPSLFLKNRPQPESRTTWASVWIGERVLIE